VVDWKWGAQSASQCDVDPALHQLQPARRLVSDLRTVITANWEAFGSNSSNRWVIPIGGGFGKIVKTGGPPLNMNLQGYYNVVNPEQGSDWQLRFTVALLFPK
jgi:hypothetical protein